MIDRIVLLNDLSSPKGGATALTLASARQFRSRGYAVTLLCGDDGNNQDLRDLGVELVPLRGQRLLSGSILSGLANGLYNKAAAEMITTWVNENDTRNTVYHLHGWAQILSPSVFKSLEVIRDRLVISAHDFFLACPNGSFSFLKTGKVCDLTPMSMRCMLSQCDRRNYGHKVWRVARQAVQRAYYDRSNSPPILAIHERMRPLLVRAGIPSSSIQTLSNPVVPYSATRVPVECNREALFVGRLEATKGPDLAAAACRAAGITLRLIGDGALRADLERDYPEMHFMGHRSPDELRELIGMARMLLVPSRYPEPYGLVAAEAMWSGLPVIMTDTAFLVPDIVAAGAGLAVEPREIEAFANAIRLIGKDDALAKRMSVAAFSQTRDIALTPEEWIDRLLEAYCVRLGTRNAN